MDMIDLVASRNGNNVLCKQWLGSIQLQIIFNTWWIIVMYIGNKSGRPSKMASEQ
jgi:hypothetical protein